MEFRKSKKVRIFSKNLDQIKTTCIYRFVKIVKNRWVSPLFLKSQKSKNPVFFFSWPKFDQNLSTDWFRQFSSSPPPILLQCLSNAHPVLLQCLSNAPPVLLQCSSNDPPVLLQCFSKGASNASRFPPFWFEIQEMPFMDAE